MALRHDDRFLNGDLTPNQCENMARVGEMLDSKPGTVDDGKGILLKSSTASSTKVFKITVTDAGALSATEVTP